jgi:hypothetical protein
LPIDKHPADWNALGNGAGKFRNRKMAGVADALVAFWDGSSPGTKDMIAVARDKGLAVRVVLY